MQQIFEIFGRVEHPTDLKIKLQVQKLVNKRNMPIICISSEISILSIFH